MSRYALVGRLVRKNIRIFWHIICDIVKSHTSGGTFRPQMNSEMQYYHWPLGKQEAHEYFSPIPGSKTASTSTWCDINYIFSSNKHAVVSILISPVADLSARQLTFFALEKKGKICDILPRCNEAVFYEMSWEEVAAERGTANAGELPCVRGGGEEGNLWGDRPAREMKSSPLLIFPPSGVVREPSLRWHLDWQLGRVSSNFKALCGFKINNTSSHFKAAICHLRL